jgi:hypothetical protein
MAAGKPVTVTKNEHDELVRECERLREELAKTRRGIAKPRGRMSLAMASLLPQRCWSSRCRRTRRNRMTSGWW